MMKKYYILSKNTTVESYQSIFNSFVLKDIEVVSYDRAVDHVFVSDIISAKNPLVLLIPTILDSFNAYSYDGVEYALKYYFHFVSIKKGDFQIILLGTEEESAFWRHCEYSSFLKCPHVSYLKNNIYPIKEYLDRIESVTFDMNWAYCIEKLKQLDIKKPASYKTHHSITNEWSIYRWSKYLGVENIEILKEIDEFLYFNYLKAIYCETTIDDSKSFLVTERGKVLIIDDEVGKGWDAFFKSFFRFSQSVTIESLGKDFKMLSQEEIVTQTIAKITDFEPDVVLLDLRLHDEDFETKKSAELTGAKIFNAIKEINKGIQIVIFSASNKIWNYLPFASDGIVLKESPEMSMKDNYTQESILNLRKTLGSCLKRKYLKSYYSKIDRIEKLLLNSRCFEDRTEEIIGCLEIAFDLLTRSIENNEYNAYAYLQLFLVIEEYVNLSTVIEITENDLYLNKGTERYRILKDKEKTNGGKYKYHAAISFNGGHYDLKKGFYESRFIETTFKVSSLLIFKFGETTSGTRNWTSINNIRNTKAAHPKSDVVSNSEIDQVLDFMLFFFDENNAKWRLITDAFSEKSIEDGVASLQEKFCNKPF